MENPGKEHERPQWPPPRQVRGESAANLADACGLWVCLIRPPKPGIGWAPHCEVCLRVDNMWCMISALPGFLVHRPWATNFGNSQTSNGTSGRMNHESIFICLRGCPGQPPRWNESCPSPVGGRWRDKK